MGRDPILSRRERGVRGEERAERREAEKEKGQDPFFAPLLEVFKYPFGILVVHGQTPGERTRYVGCSQKIPTRISSNKIPYIWQIHGNVRLLIAVTMIAFYFLQLDLMDKSTYLYLCTNIGIHGIPRPKYK